MESKKSCSIGTSAQQARQTYASPQVEETLTIARQALRPVALCAGELINSLFLYRRPDITNQPISPAELADLEREAGRSLTEEKAQQFRIRKLKKQLIDNMLESARNNSGESGKISRDFIEALVFSMLGFAIGFALGTMLCFGRHI
jgi:hypothetical protein